MQTQSRDAKRQRRGVAAEDSDGAAPAIAVRGLTKRFGDVLAVDDLSFEVPTGKVTGFLGPNGAGKSTTLRTIVGLIRPDAGEASVHGRRFVDLADPISTVGAVLDVEQFHPGRSGRNHLEVLRAAGGLDRARVDEVLDVVELADAGRRRVGGYSLGMKQRLGLAAALLGDPKVLVLDEPANGLDPAGIRWLRRFLRSFAVEGRAVFVSSHQLAEISQIAQEVVVIDRGRLVIHASMEELVGRAARAARVVSPQPEALAAALRARGLSHVRLGTDSLRVAAPAEDVGRVAAEAAIPIFGLEEEERTLEEVFFELTATTERSR